MLPEDLLQREIDALCKRYRVDAAGARAALLEAFQNSPGLIETINARHPAQDVTRLRAYKEAVKAARRRVYYDLRRYRRAGDVQAAQDPAQQLVEQLAAGAPDQAIQATRAALLQTHVSTAERDQRAFFEALFGHIDPPETVLDLGCGLQALAYPFGQTPTRRYVAIDRDARAIDLLEHYAPRVAPAALVALQVDLAAFDWDDIEEHIPRPAFDLALMLKLVPVIRRQAREALAILAEVPADLVLVTGNTQALTRHEDIRQREDRALRAFIELSGRQVLHRLDMPGEFGYLLG